jgi:hypothetical protein
MADILLMVAATVVGVGAIRWNWPRAPLLLALVLGNIAERYLFLSYSLYEWDWLKRPLVIVFAALTLSAVVWSFVRAKTDVRPSPEPQPSPLEEGAGARMRGLNMDVAITLGFLVVAAAVLVQARDWPFRTSVFPFFAGSILLGFAVLNLVRTTIGVRRSPKSVDTPDERPTPDPADTDAIATASRAEWLSAVGWMASFFVMLWLLGALVLAVARQPPLLAGCYALLSWGFVYGLFGRALGIPLP